MSFVYKIVNKINKRYYVGISRGKYTTKKLFWLKTNINCSQCNYKLKADILEYGRDNFELIVVRETSDETELLNCFDEIFPVNHVAMEKSYNIDKKYRCIGLSPKSEATKLRMSLAKKGSVYSDEILERRANAQRQRFIDYADKGIPSNWKSCKPYLIYHNKEWHYFPLMTKDRISKALGVNFRYMYKLYEKYINTGNSLICRCGKFDGIIMYNDVKLIDEKLKYISYKTYEHKDYE